MSEFKPPWSGIYRQGGRQAVGYLKWMKDFVEEPEEMLLEM